MKYSFSDNAVNCDKTALPTVSSLPRIVIETLQDVSPERKCFRMVGGVLVERTVTEILPALVNNKEQVSNQVGPWDVELFTDLPMILNYTVIACSLICTCVDT